MSKWVEKHNKHEVCFHTGHNGSVNVSHLEDWHALRCSPSSSSSLSPALKLPRGSESLYFHLSPKCKFLSAGNAQDFGIVRIVVSVQVVLANQVRLGFSCMQVNGPQRGETLWPKCKISYRLAPI